VPIPSDVDSWPNEPSELVFSKIQGPETWEILTRLPGWTACDVCFFFSPVARFPTLSDRIRSSGVWWMGVAGRVLFLDGLDLGGVSVCAGNGKDQKNLTRKVYRHQPHVQNPTHGLNQ
jgi:hypothetical protein